MTDENWKNSQPSTSGIRNNKTSRRRALTEEDIPLDQRLREFRRSSNPNRLAIDDGHESDSSSGSVGSSVEDGDDADSVSSKSSGSSSSSTSNRENCPICLNRLKKQEIGKPECCDHQFCFDCISEWSTCTNTCPIDRQPFGTIQVKDPVTGRILRKERVQNRVQANEPEEEQDLTHCEVCRRADREDRMLLCDGCDAGYHLDCLTPALDAVPLDAWFCPRCNREADTAVMPQRARRRVIPRTRANERVRARIANQLRIIEQLDAEADLDEFSDEEYSDEASTAESDDGVVYALTDENEDIDQRAPTQPTPRRATAVRRRRTTRRRRTRRKTTTKKRRSGAKASAIDSSGKTKISKTPSSGRKRRKARRKRRKRTAGRRGWARRRGGLKRSNSDPNLLAIGQDTPSKLKRRLADRLGIVKAPKKGQHLPELRATTGAVASDQPSASGQLSLFGNPNELIAFSDENDGTVVERSAQDAGPSTISKHSASVSILSDKAKKFRTPLRPYRRPVTSRMVVHDRETNQQSADNDLLGGILKGQELLLAPSSKVTIHRDGSIQGKEKLASSSATNVELAGKNSDQKSPDGKLAQRSTNGGSGRQSKDDTKRSDEKLSSDRDEKKRIDQKSSGDSTKSKSTGDKAERQDEKRQSGLEGEQKSSNDKDQKKSKPSPQKRKDSDENGQDKKRTKAEDESISSVGRNEKSAVRSVDQKKSNDQDEMEIEQGTEESNGQRSLSPGDSDTSFLQYIHPPPAVSYQSKLAGAASIRRKAPLLPSPNVPPKSGKGPTSNLNAPAPSSSIGQPRPNIGHSDQSIMDAENVQFQLQMLKMQHQNQASGAPLRYAIPVSLAPPTASTTTATSSPPASLMSQLSEENQLAMQQNSAVMIAAQIHHQQQLALLQQQQQQAALLGLKVSEAGRRTPPVASRQSTGGVAYSMADLFNNAASVQQRLGNAANEQAQLEAFMSAAASSGAQNSALLAGGVPNPSLLGANPNLAAAVAMQNALAVRQHQMNLLSTLRAASVQQQHGLIPAALVGGGATSANGANLLASSLPPHLWQQQLALATGQPPPPPPPPPPTELQLIPLPPAPFSIPPPPLNHQLHAPPPPPPPPPPPVPPPGASSGTRFDGGRGELQNDRSSSLDARISEIEMETSVPPELVSLLHQFAQIKKEEQMLQQQQQIRAAAAAQQQIRAAASAQGSGRSTDKKSGHSKSASGSGDRRSGGNGGQRGSPFAALPVSPASSSSSPMMIDMDATTPTPEPAEPTPAASHSSRSRRQRNNVKFDAGIVEADEKKVKVSKAESKQKKREEKLKKMLNEASRNGGADEDNDGVPSSAVDLRRREKVLFKFNYQVQVEEEVKNALRPYYSKRKITKDEYKDIMRKCVPKVCKKKGEIKPEKIKTFVDTCVSKVLTAKSKRGTKNGDGD